MPTAAPASATARTTICPSPASRTSCSTWWTITPTGWTPKSAVSSSRACNPGRGKDASMELAPVKVQKQVVICIDDEPPVLSAIRRLLRHEPYEVLTTLDPSEVLRLVTSREVNLIVADQRMPL